MASSRFAGVAKNPVLPRGPTVIPAASGSPVLDGVYEASWCVKPRVTSSPPCGSTGTFCNSPCSRPGWRAKPSPKGNRAGWRRISLASRHPTSAMVRGRPPTSLTAPNCTCPVLARIAHRSREGGGWEGSGERSCRDERGSSPEQGFFQRGSRHKGLKMPPVLV
jgi:hypothetical protein